ncbi:MAG: thiol-disulfide oxidoreductase, partial [Mesorhizobium sp.]
MSKPRLTVWYNTRCPVCNAGIRRQRRRLIEAVKAGRVEFR